MSNLDRPHRFAKKKLDNRSFFGGILHVSYAAEFETVDDTREKLRERRRVIARKTRGTVLIYTYQNNCTSNTTIDQCSKTAE